MATCGTGRLKFLEFPTQEEFGIALAFVALCDNKYYVTLTFVFFVQEHHLIGTCVDPG